uniref:Tektin n=1 Tax=Falco tinnunculus TaxID=100819 RepID=A0A8C4V1I8_FALTI
MLDSLGSCPSTAQEAFLGTAQLAGYCDMKKCCPFLGLAPTSTSKDTYRSHCLPGYCCLSSWRPSLLHKVVSVPPSSDKQFNPTGRLPAIVPALRFSLHARDSTRDWHHENTLQLKGSEASQYRAARLNADAMRLVQDKDQLTYQMQEDSRRNLRERNSNIDFWRSKLIYELKSRFVVTLHNAVRSFLQMFVCLQITLECLYHREKWKGIDLVHDNVEKNLIKATLTDLTKQCSDCCYRS